MDDNVEKKRVSRTSELIYMYYIKFSYYKVSKSRIKMKLHSLELLPVKRGNLKLWFFFYIDFSLYLQIGMSIDNENR